MIYSQSLSRFYVGATQHTVEQRVKEHNKAYYGKSKFTSAAKDWIVFLEIKSDSFEQALRIEKHIKRMKSKKVITKMIHSCINI
ncbi:MAG: GIY-YIG nuclease family protein [Flavobacteriales bacterium]|nr:GIY-YIG nuclease family protein [Flavobacteriales bacterium]